MGPDQPIFNVPRVVLAVFLLLVVLHFGRLLLTPRENLIFIYTMAFIPARYAGYAGELPGGEIAQYTSFVTHMLVHANLLHLFFNCAWLLAMGTPIAERIGALRFLAFAVFTGLAGALAFLVLNPGLEVPVIGASGAISGLMGGLMRFLFSAIDTGSFSRLRTDPASVPLMPLGEALRDKRVLFASAAMVVLNLAAIFGLGQEVASGGIAWQAHLGGYFAGLFTFGLFDPTAQTFSERKPTGH